MYLSSEHILDGWVGGWMDRGSDGWMVRQLD